MSKPVITGTRITVESLLDKLAAGETPEQILEAHPRLTREAIRNSGGIILNWRHRLDSMLFFVCCGLARIVGSGAPGPCAVGWQPLGRPT
jgi:hypothetical protein